MSSYFSNIHISDTQISHIIHGSSHIYIHINAAASCKRYPPSLPYIIIVQTCGKRWDLPKFVDVFSVNLGFSQSLIWGNPLRSPGKKIWVSGHGMFKFVRKHSQPIGDHPLWPCPLRVAGNFVRHTHRYIYRCSMRIWISNMESRYHPVFAMVFSTHPICRYHLYLPHRRPGVLARDWPRSPTRPEPLGPVDSPCGDAQGFGCARPCTGGFHPDADAASQGKNSSNSQQ